MSKTHQIHSVVDMLALSPEEFSRMLPDLMVWYGLCRQIAGIEGVSHIGFTWVDDGKPGNVEEVILRSAETGEIVETWKP